MDNQRKTFCLSGPFKSFTATPREVACHLQERQQFEAALRASQAQPQPQPPISSLGLPPKVGDDVDINVRRSASTKRARSENQTTDETKRARSASTSRRSPSPKRDYPRGTCTATRPSQASPKSLR